MLVPVLLAASLISSILSLVLIIAAIAVVVFLVIKLGGWLAKVLIGVAVNSILGFIVLIAIGFFFNITVIYTWPLIIAVALFGLPAVGTILLLKVWGGIALAIYLL